jgi:hypothetical protein
MLLPGFFAALPTGSKNNGFKKVEQVERGE